MQACACKCGVRLEVDGGNDVNDIVIEYKYYYKYSAYSRAGVATRPPGAPGRLLAMATRACIICNCFGAAAT